jgi:hypothetical protein
MRCGGLIIDTVVCLTLAKWETVSGQFGGYLTFTSYDNTTPTFTQTFELSRYKGNIYLKMPKSKRQ